MQVELRKDLRRRMASSLLVLIVFLSQGPLALAQEIQGELDAEGSDTFADYATAIFRLTVSESGTLTVRVDSALDTYLFVRSPGGSFRDADDSGPGTEEIAWENADSGEWLVLVTTYYPELSGQFSIRFEGASDAEQVLFREIPREYIADAFELRGVADPLVGLAMRTGLLADQLTLESFRSRLTRELRDSLSSLEVTERDLRSEVADLEEQEATLQMALSDGRVLPERTRTLFQDLVEPELFDVTLDLQAARSRLEAAFSNRLAVTEALDQIGDLDALGRQLTELRTRLESVDDQQELGRIQRQVRALQAEVREIAVSIAERLIEASLPFTDRLLDTLTASINRDDSRSFGRVLLNRLELGVINRAVSVTADDINRGPGFRDSSIWLPQLFPWPPPTPSTTSVLSRDLPGWDSTFQTLGDLDDSLTMALAAAGYSGISYWGVPHGFALVTPLEQTDRQGVPLRGVSRWSTRIQRMKEFTLQEYVRALLTAPPGFFRTIVFVVSPEPFAATNGENVLATIERWASTGHQFLPQEIRDIGYGTQDFQATALIYEFRKRRNSDNPRSSGRARHTALEHLERAGILQHFL